MSDLEPGTLEGLKAADLKGISELAAYVETHDMADAWDQLGTPSKTSAEYLLAYAAVEIRKQRRMLLVWKHEEVLWRQREEKIIKIAHELVDLAGYVISAGPTDQEWRRLKALELRLAQFE